MSLISTSLGVPTDGEAGTDRSNSYQTGYQTGYSGSVAPTESSDPSVIPPDVQVKVISIRHDEYLKYHSMWDKLRILYNGPPDIVNTVTQFLIQRPNEPADVYTKRQSRLVYTNVLETILTWYASYLLKSVIDIDIFESSMQQARGLEKPNRSTASTAATPITTKARASNPPANKTKPLSVGDIIDATDPRADYYSDFRSDVDRSGTNWTMFWREVLSKLLTYGVYYILTDKERIDPESAVTQLQSNALGGDKPYFVQYSPLSVINWRLDKHNRLEWAVIEQLVTDQPNPFMEPTTVREWWYYNRTQWAQYREVPMKSGEGEARAELVSSGNHALSTYKHFDGTIGKVPLERLSVMDGLWFGRRIMLPCINYLNAENELAWLLMQCYVPIPIVVGAANKAEGGTDYGQSKFGATISETNTMMLPSGATFSWSQPSADAANIGINRLSDLLENIYRLLYLQDQGRPSGATSASQSGYAILLTKMPSREISRTLGGKIQNYMSVMLRNVAVARNEDLRFGVRGLTFNEDTSLLALDETQRLKNLGVPSVTWIRESLKNLARSTRAFEDASDKVISQVEQEIDAVITEQFIANWYNALWNNLPMLPSPPGLESTAGSNIPGRPNGQLLGPDGKPIPPALQPGGANQVVKNQPSNPSIPYRFESSLIAAS